MKNLISSYLLIFLLVNIGQTQTDLTANDFVNSYTGTFGFGTNLGYYNGWTDEQLADIAIGNPNTNSEGVGINTLRASLPEHFLENWGYDIRVSTFQHYEQLGASENVVFIGSPSEAHRDPIEYCPGKPSESFANLYEPIWDEGQNGTPVNDDNYYALYLYKMVSRYHEQVRFWEITNEPDYDYSGNGWKDQNYEGNWFDNVPSPCDYAFRAPITHYVRMLRISYEVIKSIDPNAYVAVGGLGYPSFLDLILRHTDNPNGGTVSEAFPLYGGAYFDVLSFHSYPHINGSLRYWNNDVGGFVYERHSDRAVKGLIDHQASFQNVLEDYGYHGSLYPEKLWIITETNLPRRPFVHFGSNEAQRNFAIKALIKSQQHNILQFHTYQLGDRAHESAASNEFHLMGMFKFLSDYAPYHESINDIGVAFATTSTLLKDKIYNEVLTAQLNLQSNQDGAVFTDADGTDPVIALWAKTQHDWSETASSNFSLPQQFGASTVEAYAWNYSASLQNITINSMAIPLTAAPIFLKKQVTTHTQHQERIDFKLQCSPNPTQGNLLIDFMLSQKSAITIGLYDHFGRLVHRICANQRYTAGKHLRNELLPELPAGVYQLQIQGNNQVQTQKIVIQNS